MTAPRTALVVMAKHPEPGAVKTRMCPPLRPEEAAELYVAMLDDVLATSAEAAARAGAELWLMGTPASALAELGARAPTGCRIEAQRGPDLGARMEHAIGCAAAAGCVRILLRGSDSPAIPAGDLVAGLEALAGCDLAVGPDPGGGYAWVALRRPQPGLFDHPMSTETVLGDTLARAAAAGLRARCMALQLDLDTVEDLAGLAGARRRGEAGSCPRTLAVLDRRDHWRHLPPGRPG